MGLKYNLAALHQEHLQRTISNSPLILPINDSVGSVIVRLSELEVGLMEKDMSRPILRQKSPQE